MSLPLQAMKVAEAEAALAEMGVLLQPPEAPEEEGEEVLVEMVEMPLLQPMTHSVEAEVGAEGWDPALLQERI